MNARTAQIPKLIVREPHFSSLAESADGAYQYLRAVLAAACQNVPGRYWRSIRYLFVRQDSADKGECNADVGGRWAGVVGEAQPELTRRPGLEQHLGYGSRLFRACLAMASLGVDTLPVGVLQPDGRVTSERARGFRDVSDGEHDDLGSEQSLYLPNAQTDLSSAARRKRWRRLLHGALSRCPAGANRRDSAHAVAAANRQPGGSGGSGGQRRSH